jgi:hypothetical protein
VGKPQPPYRPPHSRSNWNRPRFAMIASSLNLSLSSCLAWGKHLSFFLRLSEVLHPCAFDSH